MRYFLLGWFLLCVVVVGIAGFRGGTSRKPPLEIFPDMDRQPKLRPQTRANFFPDQHSSRAAVAGTVARGEPFEDTPYNTGRVPGTTNLVDLIPAPVTPEMLARGQERYQINCAPCHGAIGDGKGITSKYGMVVTRNLHEQRMVILPDGHYFNVITHGFNLMGAYGANVSVSDRWAIVAYVRALQRSRLGTIDDVPAPDRAALTK